MTVDGLLASNYEIEYFNIIEEDLKSILFSSDFRTGNLMMGPFGIFPVQKANTLIEFSRNSLRDVPDISNRIIYVDMKVTDHIFEIESPKLIILIDVK